jgi:uncharacterized membrane protein HdeD (DUF308 family)
MTATTMQKQAPIIPWWVVLIEGIAAIILGFLLLINPGSTTVLIIQFLGIYWFIDGIMSIVRIFIDKTAWGWKLFSGIIGILAGMAIIQYPLWATILVPTTMVWLFGFFGIIGVLGRSRPSRSGLEDFRCERSVWHRLTRQPLLGAILPFIPASWDRRHRCIGDGIRMK